MSITAPALLLHFTKYIHNVLAMRAYLIDAISPGIAHLKFTSIYRQAIYLSSFVTTCPKLDRYNGAGHWAYSMGQHSLVVAEVLPPEYRLPSLLHDATEVYLGDVVSPLKAMLPEYRKIEQNVMNAICKRFEISFPRPGIVKRADQAVMAAEMQQVVKWPDLAKPLTAHRRPKTWSSDRCLGRR